MNVTALIPAAGAGRRMGMDRSKQYIEIGGLPVIVHTLNVFESCESISEVYLIVPEEDCAMACDIVDQMRSIKVRKVIPGGKERQDSVYNGLNSVYSADIVMIHDGVRPFITEEIIINSIDAAAHHGAATVAVPVKDTIKSADAEGFFLETIDRKKLWHAQTPQTFQYDIIKQAFSQAYKDGYYGTDDASLAERIGHRVKIVEGSYRNIKITTPEDLVIAEAIMREYSCSGHGG